MNQQQKRTLSLADLAQSCIGDSTMIAGPNGEKFILQPSEQILKDANDQRITLVIKPNSSNNQKPPSSNEPEKSGALPSANLDVTSIINTSKSGPLLCRMEDNTYYWIQPYSPEKSNPLGTVTLALPPAPAPTSSPTTTNLSPSPLKSKITSTPLVLQPSNIIRKSTPSNAVIKVSNPVLNSSTSNKATTAEATTTIVVDTSTDNSSGKTNSPQFTQINRKSPQNSKITTKKPRAVNPTVISPPATVSERLNPILTNQPRFQTNNLITYSRKTPSVAITSSETTTSKSTVESAVNQSQPRLCIQKAPDEPKPKSSSSTSLPSISISMPSISPTLKLPSSLTLVARPPTSSPATLFSTTNQASQPKLYFSKTIQPPRCSILGHKATPGLKSTAGNQSGQDVSPQSNIAVPINPSLTIYKKTSPTKSLGSVQNKDDASKTSEVTMPKKPLFSSSPVKSLVSLPPLSILPKPGPALTNLSKPIAKSPVQSSNSAKLFKVSNNAEKGRLSKGLPTSNVTSVNQKSNTTGSPDVVKKISAIRSVQTGDTRAIMNAFGTLRKLIAKRDSRIKELNKKCIERGQIEYTLTIDGLPVDVKDIYSHLQQFQMVYDNDFRRLEWALNAMEKLYSEISEETGETSHQKDSPNRMNITSDSTLSASETMDNKDSPVKSRSFKRSDIGSSFSKKTKSPPIKRAKKYNVDEDDLLIKEERSLPDKDPVDGKYHCLLCPKMFLKQISLAKHVEFDHPPSLALEQRKDSSSRKANAGCLLKCEECGKPFHSKVMLVIHKASDHCVTDSYKISRESRNSKNPDNSGDEESFGDHNYYNRIQNRGSSFSALPKNWKRPKGRPRKHPILATPKSLFYPESRYSRDRSRSPIRDVKTYSRLSQQRKLSKQGNEADRQDSHDDISMKSSQPMKWCPPFFDPDIPIECSEDNPIIPLTRLSDEIIAYYLSRKPNEAQHEDST